MFPLVVLPEAEEQIKEKKKFETEVKGPTKSVVQNSQDFEDR